MNIQYLKKEMVIHELVVRGVAVDTSKTLDQLRSALRSLLKLEKSGVSSYPPYSLKFSAEKQEIRTYIDEAKNTIENLSSGDSQNKFIATQSRLVHILNRLRRIPDSTLSSDEQIERADLLVEVLSTLDTLEETSRKNPELSQNFQDAAEQTPPLATPPPQVSPGLNSTQFPVFQQPSQKPPNVDKWNLKFTGDNKILSVHNFLERVEEMRAARHMTSRQIFDSAIDLFSGKALIWFRANKHRFNDWASLTDLLRHHFEPPDYRPRLFRDILDRTQDTSESIVEYLSCMQGLFRRYGGLSKEAQLDIVRRNLSPFYATQLPDVNTLEELEDECLKLEAKKYRAENYVPPNRKRQQQFVEPDFAFVSAHSSRISHFSSPDESPEAEEVIEAEAVYRTSSNNATKVTCWNCKKVGHLNRDCPDPKKIHCYRCGKPDVTVKDCPKCAVPGNELRASR